MASQLRSVDEHLDRILDVIAPLAPYAQPLPDVLGLSLCEDITSPVELPGFDNSGMDGYAVRAADLDGAAEDTPVRLPVVGESAAGQTKAYALAPGTALRIMTGAPMPSGADAVVPMEWTDRGVAQVEVRQAPKAGQHVRRAGEDVRIGDPLLDEGALLGPRQVGLLAAIGRAQVQTRPRPRVVVLSTGSELREPGTDLGFDSVYDSNSFMLAAAVRATGAIAYRVGAVADDPDAFADAVSDQLVRADAVITSGGVSKGEYDVVKEVLGKLGTVQFCEVAMQPGKPQGFGTVGEDATPIFTLPGNPVSSYVSFEVFVLPALRRMMGLQPYRRPTVRARCDEGFPSAAGKRQYLRGRLTGEVGHESVSVVGGPGSHLVGSLAHADCLVVVPEDTSSVEAGETVDVLALDRAF
ncbi:MAG: molybdopterin molybdotransferase MoeA [Actinomycetota bacterium]|nr:molybdopterin molybdotransferase MoeA [Actinomycetota bacterium]